MSDATDIIRHPFTPPASADTPIIYGWENNGKIEIIGPLHALNFEPIQIRPKTEKKSSKWLKKKIKYRK